MKKITQSVAITLIGLALTTTSCKREKSCICTLSYSNGTTGTETVSIGKYTVKAGQDKCNSITTTYTSTPNLSSASCVVK